MTVESRRRVALVAVAAAAALVAAAAFAGVLPSPFADPDPATDAPGSRFAGVVGVHGSEVRGELDEGSLATRLAAAENDTARAEVVAAEAAALDERLTALERQRADLDDDDESRLATVATAALAIDRQVDRLEVAAADLPPPALAAAGVDAETFADLRERASALADEEALAAARDVAGPDAGNGYDDDDDDDDDVDDDDDGDDSDDDDTGDDTSDNEADDADDADDDRDEDGDRPSPETDDEEGDDDSDDTDDD